jgi:hypothetical protein
MRIFKRRYKSKNQQVALAGFTFGALFFGIVMMVVLSTQAPDLYYERDVQKEVLLSEVVARIKK